MYWNLKERRRERGGKRERDEEREGGREKIEKRDKISAEYIKIYAIL